jgi:hypothetical protein
VGLLEVLLHAVQGQGDLFLEFLHLAQLLADLVLGIGQRLEELAVGAVPGAAVPVFLAARAVPGAGAGIEGLQGSGQADDGPRVDARALPVRRQGRHPASLVFEACQPDRAFTTGLLTVSTA